MAAGRFMLPLAALATLGVKGVPPGAPSAGLVPAAAARPGMCVAPELTTSFGAWFATSATVRPNTFPNSIARIQPGVPNLAVGGIRLQLQRVQGLATGWKLSVRSGAGRLLALFDAEDFDPDTATLWTGRLVASEVYLELISGDPTVRVKVLQGIAAPAQNGDQPQLYSVQDTASPKWETMFENSQGDQLQLRLADLVGMMHTASERAGGGVGSGRKSWCCSGVMIGSDLYLTNDHCGTQAGGAESWDQAQCDATLVDLGWEQKGIPRQFACRKVEAHDRRLDYAILRLKPVAGTEAGRGGSRVPPIAGGQVAMNQSLFMVHHASCQFKRISKPCAATKSRRAWTDPDSATDRPEFEHTCDSEPGASGAPVFDGQGRLVGLHHLGFEICNGVNDRRNKAVGIAAIRAHVVATRPELARRLGWE